MGVEFENGRDKRNSWKKLKAPKSLYDFRFKGIGLDLGSFV